jgi:hypothetical protein
MVYRSLSMVAIRHRETAAVCGWTHDLPEMFVADIAGKFVPVRHRVVVEYGLSDLVFGWGAAEAALALAAHADERFHSSDSQ